MNATIHHLPRSTDLGRLNPGCAAVRHGTHNAYQKDGCRCPHAREANRLYQKRRREGRLVSNLVDGCGTRRRIQALWAIGHSSLDIARAAPGRPARQGIARLAQQRTVSSSSAAMVTAVYRDLSVRPGRSAATARRAAAAGWPPPVLWGADIDDPSAVPDLVEPEPDLGVVDEVAVERVLAGEHLELTDDELIVTLRIGTSRGASLSALSLRLGINYAGAKMLLAGELTPRRAMRARKRAVAS